MDKVEKRVDGAIEESRARQARLRADERAEKARLKAAQAKAEYEAEAQRAGKGGSYDEEAAYQQWQRAELKAKRLAAQAQAMRK